jgi:hypothetical protein
MFVLGVPSPLMRIWPSPALLDRSAHRALILRGFLGASVE